MPFTRQIDRGPLLELLQSGSMTETAIAAKLGISRPTVHKIRAEYGLPAPLRGSTPKHASVEDAYRAHAIPTTDGHTRWTGSWQNVTPIVQHRHSTRSAYKIAFRLHHGRDPQGLVKPGCDHSGCVAGAHLTDTAMRRATREAAAAARPRRQHGPTANGTRRDILELLSEGHSDKEIGRRLNTSPQRVGKIRAEEGLPGWKRSALPVEEKWKAWVQPTPDGHAAWTGTRRGGTPTIRHQGRNHSARAVGFTAHHGRAPVGRVLPDCGTAWCMNPEHTSDDVIRRADHLYDQLFGAAA
jgi:DNA-binding CsgD family transcriptional regulator